MKPTKKIPTEWRLEKLFGFESKNKIETRKLETTQANERFVSKWSAQNDYTTDPLVLHEALKEYEELNQLYGTEGGIAYYYSLKADQNENDAAIKAAYNHTTDWATKLQNNLQFFELNISKIAKEKHEKFLNHPALQEYRHYLERLFTQGKYLLTDREEKILNLKTSTSYEKWVRMTSGLYSKEEAVILDEKGKKTRKSFEEIRNLMNHGKKRVRDAAFEAYIKIIQKWIEVGESELNAILEDKRVNDELRGFGRPDMSRHVSDDIESDVIDALLKAAMARMKIAHDYFKLKAKILKVKKLNYHERLVDIGVADKHFKFEDGYDLVKDTYKTLDPAFAEILENRFYAGAVDVYPKKNKRGGAFCAHLLKDHPVVSLLNHTGRLRDVVTIAHEFGHVINAELTNKHQNALNVGVSTATAEVASTFMEDFVFEKIEEKLTEKERLGLLMNNLSESVLSTFYCIAMYNFETELHAEYRAKRHLTHTEIGKLYKKHMSSWTGPAVIMNPGVENFYLAVPHVRYFFYMYSYASGMLISKALQRMVRKEKSDIQKVKIFLSTGRAKSPKVIFAEMGVDITDANFWHSGFNEIEQQLKEAQSLAKKFLK